MYVIVTHPNLDVGEAPMYIVGVAVIVVLLALASCRYVVDRIPDDMKLAMGIEVEKRT